MGVHKINVPDCSKCREELRPALQPMCEPCITERIEAARDGFTVECANCHQGAVYCEDCAHDGLSEKVLDYAQRRKALGFMTPEVFAAFELFADDLRAGDA